MYEGMICDKHFYLLFLHDRIKIFAGVLYYHSILVNAWYVEDINEECDDWLFYRHGVRLLNINNAHIDTFISFNEWLGEYCWEGVTNKFRVFWEEIKNEQANTV